MKDIQGYSKEQPNRRSPTYSILTRGKFKLFGRVRQENLLPTPVLPITMTMYP